MHEYVEGGFQDVIGLLRSRPSILRAAGADRATSRRARQAFPRVGAHKRHDHMATIDVHLRGVDGRLRLFSLVGGVQEPMTEILLEGTSRAENAPDVLETPRRFLEELARLLGRGCGRRVSRSRGTRATGLQRSRSVLCSTGRAARSSRRRTASCSRWTSTGRRCLSFGRAGALALKLGEGVPLLLSIHPASRRPAAQLVEVD